MPEQKPTATSNTETETDLGPDPQERLRKLLTDLELTPEQTRDDVVVHSSRDQEFLDDVPPHHG